MQTASNSPDRQPVAALRAPVAVVVGALAGCATAAANWLLVVAWESARARVIAPGPASSAELLTLTVGSVAQGIVVWLTLCAVLEVAALLPGRIGGRARQWSDRITPAAARRLAALLLGIGVGVGVGPTQALATAGRAGQPVASAMDSPRAGSPAASPMDSPRAGGAAAPGGVATPAPSAGFDAATAPGFIPTAPRVRPQHDPGLISPRPRTDADESARVVVLRGDSLWSIAADHLGAGASDAEVAAAWPAWFAANRQTIGDDPDRLLPGQLLRIPDAAELAGAGSEVTP